MIRIEKTYDASPERVWQLWTTAAGIESWWAPEGFAATVQELDVREGGNLRYTLTATAPEQIEFLKGAGIPLATASSKTFVEVVPHARLSYTSLVDFVPDTEPYEFLTIVELAAEGDRTKVTMLMEPLHDEVWTTRLQAGRQNEMENLAKVV
jgi:uncharacterized protein YndB with AHSA1/START domain